MVTSLLRRPRASRKVRLFLETLEGRDVPSTFNFADFSDVSSLNLQGRAASVNNVLRLTPAAQGDPGSAWYNVDKPLIAGNFSSTFQFQLSGGSDNNGTDGSDGFTFAIQNGSPTALYRGANGLGYDGMPNSIVIEFDTWQNSELNDSSKSSISVHTNGTGPNNADESYSLGHYDTSGFILDDAQVHTAKISYAPGTMSVYLDNLTTPVLTVSVDLAAKLNLDVGRAWVGFTAATGGGYQNHDILNWSFQGDDNIILADKPGVIEGAANTTATANFTITRIGSLTGQAIVNWSTANGTATAGSDYVAGSGQVVFADGEAQKTVGITVNGDNTLEPDETFKLNLTTTANDTAVSGQATILADDVGIAVGDALATEGDGSIQSLGALVSSGVGGMSTPYAMIIGPDGNLYVSNIGDSSVLRYDLATGSPLPAPGKTGAEFVSPGSGGLSSTRDIAFGPDGALYAASEGTDAVLRFDPTTGGFLGTLVAPGAGGLDAPRGLIFQGGYVYVTSVGTETPSAGKDSVLRYDAATGVPAGVSGLPGDAVFIASGSGGLDNPSRLIFGPDGKVYVSSTASVGASTTTNSILRYNAATGAFDTVFVSPGSGGLDGPIAMVFRPDGYLYVTGWRSNSVNRYQASNGAFVGTVVASGNGGVSNLIDLLFVPDGNLLLSSKATNQVLRYGAGSQAAFTVILSIPSASIVTVDYVTVAGTALAGSDFGATSGTLTFAPGQTTRTVLVQTVNNAIAEPKETFTLTLSNPVGATITDGMGVGTIVDDDATKFFVVDDAATNLTYRYGVLGTGQGNSALAAANSAPRGVVSNAARDKVWVVDANKNVYVYNGSGALLGSWTAGSLTGAAQVEGIATNGTDIWIVDAKQDKVFKYAGAASRLSGSQNAASSFNLNYLNVLPKDIVTDGTYLYVVNDTTNDYVHKYTLTGGYLGSWLISTPGASHPTGITLDPSNPDHLWIVDSATDVVYQYDHATSRTSGSQSASTSFALAAGNTNPQGIADPPVVSHKHAITPRATASRTRMTALGNRMLSDYAIAALVGTNGQHQKAAADQLFGQVPTLAR